MGLWPVDLAAKITSGFGLRTAPTDGASTNHPGVDISVPAGTGVVSTISGVVTAAGYSNVKGYYVEVTQGNIKTGYQHLSKTLAKVGDQITAGQKIALSGNSGVSTGAHLDYRVYVDGKAVDPTGINFGSKNSTSSSSLVASALEVGNNNWAFIIGGLLVLGLLGGRKSA